jgi:hypothetical protein
MNGVLDRKYTGKNEKITQRLVQYEFLVNPAETDSKKKVLIQTNILVPDIDQTKDDKNKGNLLLAASNQVLITHNSKFSYLTVYKFCGLSSTESKFICNKNKARSFTFLSNKISTCGDYENLKPKEIERLDFICSVGASKFNAEAFQIILSVVLIGILVCSLALVLLCCKRNRDGT